ncbi:flagellar L-ring protein FlgH [Verrucomicrobiia bacterium DG1235]|nr:flagellar L-ring protein FlgH [Verrucomicrobiae bacterium DG1235]
MRIHLFITLALLLAANLPAKSLWNSKKNNEAGMFADRTAARVGDILMIEVSEETIVNRSSAKTSSTDSNVGHGFDSLVLPDILDSDTVLPSIDISPTESFNGSGSISDANIMESKISVMVVDVKPNGNLVIEGARKVMSSGEAQYLVVRGIVRGDDVDANNTVLSANVLNAAVELFSEGDLKNAQTKGWVQRLVDVTNIL